MNAAVTALQNPRLSVVVATTQPWPEIKECVESLFDQTRAASAEFIVCDGDGGGLPEDASTRYPGLVWLKAVGKPCFVLRELGLTQSRGEIVAVTEDHCTAGSGWCEAILTAHREHPEAAAVGGVVENGATKRLIDWANFLIVFAPFTSPIENGRQSMISLQANSAYKRRVLPSGVSELGFMELLVNQRLAASGEVLIADDRLVISHNQTHGFRGSFVAHFHNGRTIAGHRLAAISWAERMARLVACGILPIYLLTRVVVPISRKGRLMKTMLLSLPLIAGLVTCHAVGEFVGYLTGPGDSPGRLR